MSGGGGGKGGSQTQTTEMEIPDWLEKEARRNIDISREISQLGYVPYFGPDVAAFTPMQEAAFQGTNQAAEAFGMQPAQSSMPEAQTYAGGVQGYSSGGLYNQSLEELQRRAPGQAEYLQGMFIDPVTGNAARSPFGSPQQQASQQGPGVGSLPPGLQQSPGFQMLAQRPSSGGGK